MLRFSDISSEFVQIFVLSVNKHFCARCKERCWLLSQPLTNGWLHLRILCKFLPTYHFLTSKVYCSAVKHLLPYTGYISKWIWVVLSTFAHKTNKMAFCSLRDNFSGNVAMLLIITSTDEKLLINVNIDNLEWPWTLKYWFNVIFLAIFGYKRVNYDEMYGDRLRLLANRNCYRLSRVSWALLKFLV